MNTPDIIGLGLPSLLRGFAPTAFQAYPRALSQLGFVAGSETVGGWASPIVSAHRYSAPV